jgi:hypothetical protein
VSWLAVGAVLWRLCCCKRNTEILRCAQDEGSSRERLLQGVEWVAEVATGEGFVRAVELQCMRFAETCQMKRYLPMLCAVLAVGSAAAQSLSGDGAASRSVHAELDGKCKAVRPGDVVHFTLDVQGVQYARAVYADLQMRLGRTYTNDVSGLPAPDFRNLGGGGPAMRDEKRGDTYHFSFTVPRDVLSGIYHGAGVYVTAAENAEFSDNGSRNVEVTNRTIKKVREYCLIVVSPYGGVGQPLVTDFKGGPIDRRAVTSTDAPSSRIFLPTR